MFSTTSLLNMTTTWSCRSPSHLIRRKTPMPSLTATHTPIVDCKIILANLRLSDCPTFIEIWLLWQLCVRTTYDNGEFYFCQFFQQQRRLDLLTITDPTNLSIAGRQRVIFVTSRVHPGETPASLVIQGLIDFLLSDSKEAKKLREKFVFKIVPMLNPDGVFLGNYRWLRANYTIQSLI